jgi:hypothetical protein
MALPALLVAGAAWLLASELAGRIADSRALRWSLVGGAIALRLAVLGGDPGLSDDVHRYVWEGALVLEGVSPYAEAPAGPARSAERARRPELFRRVNHPEVSAAYPPLTQLACAGVLAAAGGLEVAESRRPVVALRVAFALADLGVLLLLLGELRRRGRPQAWAVLWAWSPLVALEYAGSAHFDSLGILLLLAALLLLERARGETRPVVRLARENLGFLLLGLGGLVKLLPLALVPFAARGRRLVRGATLATLVFAAGLLPLLPWEGGTAGLTRGVGDYALRWEASSLLFRWLEPLLEGFLERDGSLLDLRRVARGVVLLVWLGIALRCWQRRSSPTRAALVLIGAFLVLTPTLHPWYLTWIVPFLVLRPARAWALLLWLAPLLYWPRTEWLSDGAWREPAWLWPVVALPFFAGLLLAALVRRRRSTEAPA